jgi:hypothetical protein
MRGYRSSGKLGCISACAGMTLRLVRRSARGVAAVALLAGPAAAQEKPAEIIAAHIRTQGYACENALAAQRNRKASRPNETVWILRCSNGTYRVRLVPDMAASVELVKSDQPN